MSTIVTRAGKGSALTHNEVDANFNNLNNDKIEAAQSVTLTNKTLSTGTAITAGTINNATIGASTPSSGAFTTLSASSTVSGTGFSTYLASPPAIGGTAPAAGSFTTLSATGVTTVQAGTVSTPAITTSGDTNTGIFFPAADTIAFTEGGVESMRIDSAGNMIVGGTTSFQKFNVIGSAYVSTNLGVGGIQNPAQVIHAYNNGNVSLRLDNAVSNYWDITNNSNLVFNRGGTDRMTLDASGNLGVGATSVLSTVGRVVQILNSGSSAATLQLQDSTTGSTASDGLQLQVNGATSYLWSYENGPLIFGTNNTERMRITSAGDVGIGTSLPAQRLELSIVSGTYQMRLGAGTTSTAFTYDIGRSTADGYLRFYGNQTGATGYIFGGIDGTRMTIDTSGNLGLGVTPSAWNSGISVLQLPSGASIAAGAYLDNFATTLSQNAYNNNGWKYIGNAFALRYAQIGSDGSHRWFTAGSGTAGNAITFTQAMTLDANGKLSIGTTSAPIGSGVRAVISNANGGGLQFDQSGSGGAVLPNGGSAGLLFFTYTGGVGSESYTERARIDSSGFTQFSSNLVMPYQGAPTSKSGAATLTGAELVTGILNTTGTTYTITLPTGTNIEGALTWSANNVSLDWYVINTASGTITIGANGNTTLGSLTIATGTSAHFRIRRTAANTFTVYRL